MEPEYNEQEQVEKLRDQGPIQRIAHEGIGTGHFADPAKRKCRTPILQISIRHALFL